MFVEINVMCCKYGTGCETWADVAVAQPWFGQIGVTLCAVPESDAKRMRITRILDSGEMGARPPLADSVRE